MPLRLKSLELHGYKTFAAKTNFEFAEGITAIVGPNGSGKSNIADSLRWVFGEQSYSLLRAKKTEDMIFAGSEQRPRLGMASAGVIFDNADGWLPVDFTEVALARRSYRDGRNEYLLNGQHVRLKDIHELLAQSGLSERTYTILGQGLVDASLALKADERRRLFEEAAGIGLYRSRREEALHRLDVTKRNLDRVLDILAELEPRLKSLERQAARAQDYAQIQNDLRVFLREWYGFHWHEAQRELTEKLNYAHSQETKLAEARKSYEHVRQNFLEFREHLNGLRAKLNSWHRQSAQLHESRETFSGNLARIDERQSALLSNRQTTLIDQSRLCSEVKIAQEQITDSEVENSRLKMEFDEAQTQKKTAQEALEERQSERSRNEAELQSIRRKIEGLTTLRAGQQARMGELASHSGNQMQRLEMLTQAIVSIENGVKKAAQEHENAVASRQRIEIFLQKAEADLELALNRQAEIETRIKEIQSVHSSKQAERARFKAQLEVLDQAEQTFTGYASGARLLLKASRHQKLGGVHGALSAILDVPVEIEVAIAAVLNEYTDAILLETGQDAEQAMSLLDTDQAGMASLLPLDWLIPGEPLNVKKSAECLGVASDLVTIAAPFRPALELLLGKVLVVRNRIAARRILPGQPKDTLAVTLRGEVFHATGQVTIGRTTKVTALGRPRQRRELQDSLATIEQQLTQFGSELQALIDQIESARSEVVDHQGKVKNERLRLDLARNIERETQIRLESNRQQLEWQASQKNSIDSEIIQLEKDCEQISVELLVNGRDTTQAQEALRNQVAALSALGLDEYQEQLKFWSTSLAVAERVLRDAQTRHQERTIAFDRMLQQQTTLEKRLVEIEKSMEELENERQNLRGQVSGINLQLEELRTLIEPAEKELATSESLEINLEKQETEGQVALAHIERAHNQAQLDLSRKQESLTNLRQKIADDFGLVDFEYANEVSGPVPLPFDGLVEQLPLVKELPPDLEENMTRLRAQLRRMGAINPEAKQEYHSVKERFAFLKGQLEDLQKAEADLHQVIAELDELTRREFQKTFEAVAEQFHSIFHRLFGGGMARLVLTDPEDLTETGIDIEARLPGRREQGLSLLSGGERSLTAIALVFSLLKVSPTPVCVMDEVDAMLDEANVGRFRDLLLELSKETQFIVITHNRNTVQAANVIYGVTMGRDSASQIISLKLDEISDEYLK